MDILLHWLQDEVKLPGPVDDLAEHFSNGYAFAVVLHNTNQMTPAEFGQCVQDGKSDSKIQNYCQLFPVFRRLGIKFDARVAQQLMLRKPGIAQRVLYELRTVLAPLSRVRVGRDSESKQRLLKQRLTTRKPQYDAAQAAIFERNIRAAAENQNTVFLDKHMAKFKQHVDELWASRDATHAARVGAHRSALRQQRQQRLHALRTRHMVVHAREEAGIREWQRNQEIRLAQVLAAREFRATKAAKARSAARRRVADAQHDTTSDIAAFEARAVAQGVPVVGAEPLDEATLRRSVAPEADEPSTEEEAKLAQLPGTTLTSQDTLHLRLTRKLATIQAREDSEPSPVMQRLQSRGGGGGEALAARAARRSAFLVASRASRTRLHARQRHAQLKGLLMHRCASEQELDDVVLRTLKCELVFRQNRACREAAVAEQARRDADLQLARQRASLLQQQSAFEDDVTASADGMVEAAGARRRAHVHRAHAIALACVQELVEAALGLACAREASNMRLLEQGVGSAAMPSLCVPQQGEEEGKEAEGKEEGGGVAKPDGGVLVQCPGGVDPLTAIFTRVGFRHAAGMHSHTQWAASQALPLPDVLTSPDFDDVMSPKAGGRKSPSGRRSRASDTADDAHTEVLTVQRAAAASLGDAGAATLPADAAADETSHSQPMPGVPIPPGVVVAMLGVQAQPAGCSSHGEGPSALDEGLPKASVEVSVGVEDDASEGGDGEEGADAGAVERIQARSGREDDVEQLRLPSGAGEGGAVSVGGSLEQAPVQSGDGSAELVPQHAPCGMADAEASPVAMELFQQYVAGHFVRPSDAPVPDVLGDEEAVAAAQAPLEAPFPPVLEAESSLLSPKKSPSSKKGKADVAEVVLPHPAPQPALAAEPQLHAAQHLLGSVLQKLRRATGPEPALPPACDVPQFPLTVALVGPPGSGVSTQAGFLAAALSLKVLRPNALMSQALSMADGSLSTEQCDLTAPHAEALKKVGQHARAAMAEGAAVPEVCMVQAVLCGIRDMARAPVDPSLVPLPAHGESPSPSADKADAEQPHDTVPAAAAAPMEDANGEEQKYEETGPASAKPLARGQAHRGWILDGFPQTLTQAVLLEEALTWQAPELGPGLPERARVEGRGTWDASAARQKEPTQGDAWEAGMVPPVPPHPVLDADADEEDGLPSHRAPQPASAPVPLPKHPHGVKLLIRLVLPPEQALRKVLGVRVDPSRLVTLQASDAAEAAAVPRDETGSLQDVSDGDVPSAGAAVFGHEGVDSTVRAGARGLNPPAALRGEAMNVVVGAEPLQSVTEGKAAQEEEEEEEVRPATPQRRAEAGGPSSSTAPRQGVVGAEHLAAEEQSTATFTSGLPGAVPAVDEVRPGGGQREPQVHEVSPDAMLPVLPGGYVVSARRGHVAYHLDLNPPPHKCRTVEGLVPPSSMDAGTAARLPSTLTSSTLRLPPPALAEAMERYFNSVEGVDEFFWAGSRGSVLRVAAWRPHFGTGQGKEADSDGDQDSSEEGKSASDLVGVEEGAGVVADGDGRVLWGSDAWAEYAPVGAWAASGKGDVLTEASLFAVLSRAASAAEEDIAAREAAREQAWKDTLTRRDAALAADATSAATELAFRRGEDVHVQVVDALEAQQAEAAAAAVAAAASKKSGSKGKSESPKASVAEGKSVDDDGSEHDSAQEEALTASSLAAEEAEVVAPSLHEPYVVAPDLPSAPSLARAPPASPTAEPAVSDTAEDVSPRRAEAQAAAQAALAARAAAQALVVTPTRFAGALEDSVPRDKALGLLAQLWQQAVSHYGQTLSSSFHRAAMEQVGVHARLGETSRFVHRFLRRPVPAYQALMRHAQDAINSLSWAERMGPSAEAWSQAPSVEEAALQVWVEEALEASGGSKAAASKKGKGAATPEAQEPSPEAEAEKAALRAAATRAQLAETVQIATSCMLATAEARRESALHLLHAKGDDGWVQYVQGALASHFCSAVQAEGDRLVASRLVLMGYMRAADGADGCGILTGRNAAHTQDPEDEDTASTPRKGKATGASPKSGSKKSAASEDIMPDSTSDMLQLREHLEGTALSAVGAGELLAAGHVALPWEGSTGDDRTPSTPRKGAGGKKGGASKAGKAVEEESSAVWPLAGPSPAAAIGPVIAPVCTTLPVAPPRAAQPTLASVPVVPPPAPDACDGLWQAVKQDAAAAPDTARSGSSAGKKRSPRKGPSAVDPDDDGLQHWPTGWPAASELPGTPPSEWEAVAEAAGEAASRLRTLIQGAALGTGVAVPAHGAQEQALMEVLDAAVASLARATASESLAQHFAVQAAARAEALSAAQGGKGSKKGGSSKAGSKKDKRKGGKDDPAPDEVQQALAWRDAACPPPQADQALRLALQGAESLAVNVLRLVDAEVQTQELQRQRHAALAVARERQRRRLESEAAEAEAEATAAMEAAQLAEEEAAAAAAAAAASPKKASSKKDKASAGKGGGKKDKKAGKEEVVEASHLPLPDAGHATVPPATWSAVVAQVQEFRHRVRQLCTAAGRMCAAVEAAASRAMRAGEARINYIIDQEVRAVRAFEAYAMQAVASGARLPYELRFVRPHAAADLDLLLPHHVQQTPSLLRYQVPEAAALGRGVPHPFALDADHDSSAEPVPEPAEHGEGKDAAGAPGLPLLKAPVHLVSPTGDPLDPTPSSDPQEHALPYFQLHFHVDITKRVLPPPTANPRPPLLVTDTPLPLDASVGPATPTPQALYALAMRLRGASLRSAVGGALHERMYHVDSDVLWPSPPPMHAESMELSAGEGEEEEEEAEAEVSRKPSSKSGKSQSAGKGKGGKKAGTKEGDEAEALAAAQSATAQAVLEREKQLLGAELAPAGTFLTLREFLDTVSQAVQEGELPEAWKWLPEQALAELGLCFATSLDDLGSWSVHVEVEPESSVQARIQYAKWQAKEVERLVKEEREAQAKADAEEAERLGITIAEVVAMRKASTSGRQAAEDGEDEDGLGPLPSDAATDAGEGGDEASGATPRSLRRMPSGSSVYSADDAGSVMDAEASHGPSRRCVAGSPLDAQQLSALLPTQGSLLSPLASTVLGAGAESGGLAADSTAQASSVLPVEDVSAEDAGMMHDTSKTSLGAGASEQVADAAGEGKASDEADAGESTRQRFSRLCPGPADWPWEEPAGIRPRTKVVLHHPLLHRQAPLAMDAEEWEALVHTWGDTSVLELPAACPTTAPRRDLQLALHQALQACLEGPSVEGSSDVSGHDDVPEGKAGEPPSPPAELSTPASVVQEQFAQGVWPPIAGDVTTSGIVHEVKPVPVSAPGAVWIDWDVAFVEGQSAPAVESPVPELAAAPAAAAAAGANFASTETSTSAESPADGTHNTGADSATSLSPQQRLASARASAAAAAMATLHPPVNFSRLVDWRAFMAWMCVTGPSPTSKAFADNPSAPSDIEDVESRDLWAPEVQGGRDFAVPDIRAFATTVGKGWGIAAWPDHDDLDALHLALQAASDAAASPGSSSAASEGVAAPPNAGAGTELSVVTHEGVHPALPAGVIQAVAPELSPEAASPEIQPEPAPEAGTPRSRKKGKGKRGGASEEPPPPPMTLTANREWRDPLTSAQSETSALLPHLSAGSEGVRLWFQGMGLHAKPTPVALADAAAAAAAQGGDAAGLASRAEAEVEQHLAAVSASRTLARSETGLQVGWHNVSAQHGSQLSLYVSDMAARAQILRGQADEEVALYTALADRDVAASVKDGDDIMRGVLFQAMSDVRGQINFGRLLGLWRRRANLLDRLPSQLPQEEGEEAPHGDSPVEGLGPLPCVRRTALMSAAEAQAVAQDAQDSAALPGPSTATLHKILLDLYGWVSSTAARAKPELLALQAAAAAAAAERLAMAEEEAATREADRTTAASSRPKRGKK